MRMETRRQIIEALVQRDGPGCFYCRAELLDDEITFDHFVPRSKGGENTVENFRISCQPCNNRKGDRHPAEAKVLVPQPRPSRKHRRAEKVKVRKLRITCDACLNGRRLDQRMICGACGRLPLPPHRNHMYRKDMGKCDHANTWCGMCSIFDELRVAPLAG